MRIIGLRAKSYSLRIAIVLVMIFFGNTVFGSQAVTAVPSPFIPDPGQSIPQNLRTYFEGCYGPLTPAVANWISKRNSGGTTVITVPYGTTYADLDLHLAGIVCRGDSQVSETRSYVKSASVNVPGSITGLNGVSNRIDYTGSPGGYKTPRTYRHADTGFRFTPSQPFTESKTYRINVVTENVNKFPNNSAASRYACVAPKGYPQVNIPNFESHNACYDVDLKLDIRVNIKPHDPIGAAYATCEADKGRIRIDGGVKDPNLPGQSIWTSFWIDNDRSPLVDGPTRRGALFSFYTSDARLLDGNTHYLRMLVYDDNDRSQAAHYVNDPNNPNVNFPLIEVKCPKPATNKSQCTPFPGGFGLPAASGSEEIVLRDTNYNEIPNKNVQPGQSVLLGVSMKNTGTSTWNGGFGVYSLTAASNVQSVASAPAPYDSWPTDTAANPKRVYYQNGNGTTPENGTVNFWFKVTIPTNQPSGEFSLDWRMRQTIVWETRPIATFGDTCSIKLQIPENRPFLTVGGGDVFSGASFASSELVAGSTSSGCVPTLKALSADIETNGYHTAKGTTGFAKIARIQGTSTAQYAVFASGRIGDDDDYGSINTLLGNYGYERTSTNDTKDALFANINNGDDYGNFFNGGVLPCVDIRQKQQENSGTISSGEAVAFIKSNEGVKTVNGNFTLPGTSIDSNGKDKTLIVNGTVTLGGNITYSGPYANASKIPHLTIIAQNIYIPYATRQIDADLIAMPTLDTGGNQVNGVIDTCSGYKSTAGKWFSAGADAPITSSCGYQRDDGLVFNGSVAARRVLWKRTHGTLGIQAIVASDKCYFGNYFDDTDPPKLVAADNGRVVQRYRNCAAERIDANPQSLINLLNQTNQNQNVPTSTVELPPVY